MVTLRFADMDREASTEDVEDNEDDWSKNVEEIVDKYFPQLNLENCDEKDIDISFDEYKKSPSSEEYHQKVKNHNKLQDIQIKHIENLHNSPEVSNKLFFEEEKNKIIYSCYYCVFKTAGKLDYEKHVILKHSKGLAYPDIASITKEGLKPQGKPWEREDNPG